MTYRVFMLVGVPGSGKSYFIDQLFMEYIDLEKSFNINVSYHIYSTDDEIETLCKANGMTYDQGFSKFAKKATTIANNKLKQAIKDDVEFIVWDQTNLTPKVRTKKLGMIPDHYHKIAVVFPTPEEEEHIRRLESRSGKTIPENVMRSMMESFTEPTLDEGFEKILYSNDFYWA